ncbi:Uncharacterised protein [Mycobacteroides abscessus subsp. abscessus]|nr:Uncharacterised protein [Mycobacteroides abscessus subsp. abscessus]
MSCLRFRSKPTSRRTPGCIAWAEHTWMTWPTSGRISNHNGSSTARTTGEIPSVGSGNRVSLANSCTRKGLVASSCSTMSS